MSDQIKGRRHRFHSGAQRQRFGWGSFHADTVSHKSKGFFKSPANKTAHPHNARIHKHRQDFVHHAQKAGRPVLTLAWGKQAAKSTIPLKDTVVKGASHPAKQLAQEPPMILRWGEEPVPFLTPGYGGFDHHLLTYKK